MFFSVIIPLYNKAQYVTKTIESVRSQTFADWELIVVDDGSKDDSYAVALQAIAGCDKARLVKQDNAGVSTARNNGVAMSKGDYVCFLDADDWWDPSFLEEMALLISEFPEAGIYGTSYYIVKNGKNKVAPIALDKGFVNGYIDYVEVYSRFLCMPLTSISVAIPRSVFNEMQGFKPQLYLGEDFDLWLRIALKHKVAFVNKPLAYYNQDVELQGRAVGHLHAPETTEYCCYDEYEQFGGSSFLKQLLDNKRVYGLLKYYLSKQYHAWAKMELDKVDWTKQPIKSVRQYKKNLTMFRVENSVLMHLSHIKNRICKL